MPTELAAVQRGADDRILRGVRQVGRIDLASADWQRQEHGVDVLVLSEDPVSGASTFALRTPPGLVYPGYAHFQDCDQDLFQLEGEFQLDELLSSREGDYLFRPAGTVCVHGEGSGGGIIIASLGRRPVRVMFEGHPGPGTGHYRVDRPSCDHPVEPMVVRPGAVDWLPSGLSPLVDLRRLRGEPGQPCTEAGASVHSPWGADAVCLLRIRAGFAGRMPLWPGHTFEMLATAGRARIDGRPWYRGCYAFGGPGHVTEVETDLVLYLRCFSNSRCAELSYDELLARALEHIHLPDLA
ncbi:MAG: hypothetical protein JJT85_02865 [Chromatiales bacterium]|nr:hypothetical protein [Chromatiales bacterium]